MGAPSKLSWPKILKFAVVTAASRNLPFVQIIEGEPNPTNYLKL